MKRLFLTLGMLVVTGVFVGTSAYAENLTVKKVIEVPGATKEQLFQKVLEWPERYGRFYSADENSGVIVTNGEIEYPSPPIDRIQYSFLFKIKNSIQKNKVTVAFEDVMLKTHKSYVAESVAGQPYIGGEVGPVQSKKDIAAANKILNYVATNLADYLHSKATTSCPMERCKECGLLCTSPEQMKEYMKLHGGH